MLVGVLFCAVCSRDRGCSVHPVFPAPSVWRLKEISGKAGAHGAARTRSCVLRHANVVPAHAGTHNHRRLLEQKPLATVRKREAAADGSLRSHAFAGTTAESVSVTDRPPSPPRLSRVAVVKQDMPLPNA